jgi:hypothetical protein
MAARTARFVNMLVAACLSVVNQVNGGSSATATNPRTRIPGRVLVLGMQPAAVHLVDPLLGFVHA